MIIEAMFVGDFTVEGKTVSLNKDGKVSNFRNFINYGIDHYVKNGFSAIYFTITIKDNGTELQEIFADDEAEIDNIINRVEKPLTFNKK